MSWKEYLLNIDTIVIIIVCLLVLFFFFRSKWKRYRFNPPTSPSFSQNRGYRYKRYNKYEEECRRIFQKILGCRFKSIRPEWLKNPVTKKNLELDGFNSNILTPRGKGLAFEYDGQQHSKYTPRFHKGGTEEFAYQVVKDSWKDRRCQEMGIVLIRIPHFVAFQDLERYIRLALNKEKIKR